MSLPTSIVSTSDRPDLVEVTARWRWEAFFHDTEPFEDVLRRAERTSAMGLSIPRTLVLLVDDEPVGTASLTAHDLDERPDLTPWLAGMFVVPEARGRGYAAQLIAAVEEEARKALVSTLWLYTNTAERVYARAGWRTIEILRHGGKPFALMRRDLPNHRRWRGADKNRVAPLGTNLTSHRSAPPPHSSPTPERDRATVPGRLLERVWPWA
jgi:GNAT superfamily N-acetyltransferase